MALKQSSFQYQQPVLAYAEPFPQTAGCEIEMAGQ